jgi:Flp pilus assembly protein CpaB
MRASTVFALALALLVALGAAAAAKAFGLFDKKPEQPPPPPPPPYKILVAKINLFEDMTVMSDQVMIREIAAEEQKQLETRFGERWKERLMPPLVTAAHLRTPRRNILADQPLFRDDFSEQTLPDEVSKRLEPNTRAVNVAVTKERSGGGVLRTGEYADVLLTTEIGYGDAKELRTACIARGCKIIMKRNNPWPVMAADPDNKPMHFTLQANPYRAALIEYAQTHGQLSLQPAPPPTTTTSGTFSDPASTEYATEDQRVEKMRQGSLTIGDKDLARIFNLGPPPVKPVPPPSTVIQHLAGVKDAGYTVIPHGGAYYSPAHAPAPAPNPVQPAGGPGGNPGMGMGAARPNGDTQPVGYTFRLPSSTGNTGCKSCEEERKRRTMGQ